VSVAIHAPVPACCPDVEGGRAGSAAQLRPLTVELTAVKRLLPGPTTGSERHVRRKPPGTGAFLVCGATKKERREPPIRAVPKHPFAGPCLLSQLLAQSNSLPDGRRQQRRQNPNFSVSRNAKRNSNLTLRDSHQDACLVPVRTRVEKSCRNRCSDLNPWKGDCHCATNGRSLVSCFTVPVVH
jgi:hypothetical protein